MADYQQITIEESNGVTIVGFRTHKILDELHVKRFGEELLSLIESEKREALLLNFENVEFLSSAALGHLIKLDKRAKSNNAKLVLANIKETIYEVFSITRLDKVFNIQSTLEDGMAVFGG